MDDPVEKVDDLLAAPDTLKQSKKDLRLYLARKAEEEREQFDQGNRTCTLEELLDDILRVAKDKVTNPLGWKLKQVSSRRYRIFGHFPMSQVFEHCGQFQHAKEMLGLTDEPGTRLLKVTRANSSRVAHRERYLDRFVRPYVIGGDHQLRRSLNGESIVLSISDTHATYLHPFTWQCFIRSIIDLQLGEDDIVLFNGDTLEGSAFSRHPKIPGAVIPLSVELAFQKEMVRQVREVAGFTGHLILNPGNHGLDRWANFFTQTDARLIADLPSLRVDELFGLKDYNVLLPQGGSHMSPVGTETQKQGMLLHGFYRVHHGTRLGQNPAMMELRDAGRSGQSGHVHRAQLYFGTTERERGMSWMVTPMGCTPEAGAAYMKGTNDGWQTGFGFAVLAEGDQVRQYPVLTDNGYCHIEGFCYRDREAEFGPNPLENWLPHLTHAS
jgi:hypothetical protein